MRLDLYDNVGEVFQEIAPPQGLSTNKTALVHCRERVANTLNPECDSLSEVTVGADVWSLLQLGDGDSKPRFGTFAGDVHFEDCFGIFSVKELRTASVESP